MAQWTDERHRKAAAVKAEKIKAKLQAEIPLFAEQEETPSAEALYWHWRKMRAINRADAGENIMWADWLAYRLRWIASQVLPAEAFTLLDGMSWKGPEHYYWRCVLLGKMRRCIKWERQIQPGPYPVRHADGSIITILSERVIMTELEHWPPADWQPPFSAAELDAITKIPLAPEHPGAINPLNL